jgi:hypothetical protein
LRTHLLPEAWIAPTQVRERRRLARTRTWSCPAFVDT